MTNLNLDRIEQRIDAALGSLPHWQPPKDFASRLAAAAARQSLQAVVSPALLQAGNLLQRLSDSVLIVLAALAVAGLFIWVVPWTSLAQATNLISWFCGTALVVTGLWMTQRTLAGKD